MKKIFFFLICLIAICLGAPSSYASAKILPSSQITPSGIVNLIMQGDVRQAGKMVLRLEKRLKGLDPEAAQFVLGYVKYRMGKFSEAVLYLKNALSGLPLIQDHVRYFLGMSCLEMGADGCAIEHLGLVIADYPGSVWIDEARWGLARANTGAGKFGEALAILNKVSFKDSEGISEDRYNLLKASIMEGLGHGDAAAGLLKAVYMDARSKHASDEAMVRLKGMQTQAAREALGYIGSFEGGVQRAGHLIDVYRHAEGLKILEDLSSKRNDLRMRELLAGAYFKSRNYEKAKKLYKELAAEKKGGEALHYLVRLAQSAARTDDFETAIDTYRKIIKMSRGQSVTTYLYKLGFLYMDSGAYDKARDTFLELTNYRGYLRKDILWNLAWCYYRLGMTDDAIRYFSQFIDGGFGKSDRNRALYWMARCREKKGERAPAHAIYRRLLSDDRFGYYGFLASKRLYDKEGVPNDWIGGGGYLPVILNGVKDPPFRADPAGQALDCFGRWPRNDGGTCQLPAGLDNAAYLSGLGIYDLARMEMERFNRGSIVGEADAVAFMEFAREVSDFKSLNLMAVERFKGLLDGFPYRKDGLRHFVWSGWYPDAFPVFVEKFSHDFGVEDRFVYSIMREESRFQPDVVSKADAVGLMQIIPSTAMRLAGELGLDSFELNELYRPEINIRLGVKYLSDLSGMFTNEKVYMIASYNAGEEAVSRWIKNSEANNIEEFIEEIPYDETNAYVKKVLKTYWIYREL